MALPVTVSGSFTLNDGIIAISAAGNVYAIGSLDSNDQINVYKASDPTSSFTQISTGVLPNPGTRSRRRYVQEGDLIHVAGVVSTTGHVEYSQFDMSTDAWVTTGYGLSGATKVRVFTASNNGTIIANTCDIDVRSTGEVVIFSTGDTGSTMGGEYTDVIYSRSSGGAWTSGVVVASTGAKNDSFESPALAINDGNQAHFAYRRTTDSLLYIRALSSANVLRTERTKTLSNTFDLIQTNGNDTGFITQSGGDYILFGGDNDNFFWWPDFDDDTNPTVSEYLAANTSVNNNKFFFAVDRSGAGATDIVYLLEYNFGLNYVKGMTDEGSLGSFTALNSNAVIDNGTAQGNYETKVAVYNRSGNTYLAWLYGESATVERYDEYQVASGGPTTHTASGTPTLNAVTVAGTATHSNTLTASGTPSISAVTALGVAERILTASGTVTLAAVTAAGEASGLVELTADGAVALTTVDTNAPVVSGKTYDAPTNASTFTINETCTLYVAWHLESAGIPTLNANGTWTGTILESDSVAVTASNTYNPAYTTNLADRMTYGFIDAEGNVSQTITEVFSSETALVTGLVDTIKLSTFIGTELTLTVDLSELIAGDILFFSYGKHVIASTATVAGVEATRLGDNAQLSGGRITTFMYVMPAAGSASTSVTFTGLGNNNGHVAVFAYARNAVYDGVNFAYASNGTWDFPDFTGVTPTDADNAILAFMVGNITHTNPYPFVAPLTHIQTTVGPQAMGALAIAEDQPVANFATFGDDEGLGRMGGALISVSRQTKIATLGGQGTGVSAIRYNGTAKLSLTEADGGTTFTAKSGKNRLLICILQWGTGIWSGFPTVTIGGKTPVLHGQQMGGDGNNASHIQIYYLKDADIPTGSIGMTVDFPTTAVGQLFARIIEKENVDQTTPLGAAVMLAGTTVTVNMTTATGEMLSSVSQRATTGNGPWTVTTGTEIFDDMLGTQNLTVAIAEEQPGVTGNLTHTYTPTVGGNGQKVSGFEIFKAQPAFIPIMPNVAYSTRRIVESYTGPLLRVRRASDNAELDIGYGTDNWLYQPDLLLFAFGGDAFVTTWYDQTGNGNHATSTVATEQPKIVNSGVIIKYANGSGTNRPYFGSSTTSLFEHLSVPSAIYAGWTAATAFAAWVQGSYNGAAAQGAPYTFSKDQVIHHIPYQNSNAYYGLFSTTRLGPLGMGVAHNLNVPTINAQMHTGTTSHLYKDGVQIGTGVAAPALENSGLFNSVILAAAANSLTAATIGEFVMYDTALSAGDLASINAYLAAGYMD